MTSNLKWKAILVASVILLCIYGLVGMPDFPTSLGGHEAEFWKPDQVGA